MKVAHVRTDPVYVDKVGKYLIEKTENSDSADIYFGLSPGLCLWKTEKKSYIPDCSEVFG